VGSYYIRRFDDYVLDFLMNSSTVGRSGGGGGGGGIVEFND
jgi:hypothetical protein